VVLQWVVHYLTGWVDLVKPPNCLRKHKRTQTPITYLGPSKEPEQLVSPECKVERKYGAEVRLKVFGGDDDQQRVVFKSEVEFLAAVVVNKTFDFKLMEAR